MVTSYPNGSLCVRSSPGWAGGCVPTLLAPFGAEETAFPPNGYDTIIMLNTIEHCQDALAILHNIYSSLKPGGTLIFSEEVAESMQTNQCHPLRLQLAFYREFLSHFETPMAQFRKHNHNSVFAVARKPSCAQGAD